MLITGFLPNTRRWLRRRAAALQGAWRARRGGAQAACEAMFALNRYAKRWGDRTRIYRLKTALIRELWFSGVPCTVTTHVQEQECWGYYDRPRCAGASCRKCGGTGVYRSTTLYLFRFSPAGTGFGYSWHQPAGVMPADLWRQAEAAAWGLRQPYEAAESYNDPAPARLSLWELELAVGTVRGFLARAGVEFDDEDLEPMDAFRAATLNEALGEDLQVIADRVGRWRRRAAAWWWTDVIGAQRVEANPLTGALEVVPLGAYWGECYGCGRAAWCLGGYCPPCADDADSDLPF